MNEKSAIGEALKTVREKFFHELEYDKLLESDYRVPIDPHRRKSLLNMNRQSVDDAHIMESTSGLTPDSSLSQASFDENHPQKSDSFYIREFESRMSHSNHIPGLKIVKKLGSFKYSEDHEYDYATESKKRNENPGPGLTLSQKLLKRSLENSGKKKISQLPSIGKLTDGDVDSGQLSPKEKLSKVSDRTLRRNLRRGSIDTTDNFEALDNQKLYSIASPERSSPSKFPINPITVIHLSPIVSEKRLSVDQTNSKTYLGNDSKIDVSPSFPSVENIQKLEYDKSKPLFDNQNNIVQSPKNLSNIEPVRLNEVLSQETIPMEPKPLSLNEDLQPKEPTIPPPSSSKFRKGSLISSPSSQEISSQKKSHLHSKFDEISKISQQFKTASIDESDKQFNEIEILEKPKKSSTPEKYANLKNLDLVSKSLGSNEMKTIPRLNFAMRSESNIDIPHRDNSDNDIEGQGPELLSTAPNHPSLSTNFRPIFLNIDSRQNSGVGSGLGSGLGSGTTTPTHDSQFSTPRSQSHKLRSRSRSPRQARSISPTKLEQDAGVLSTEKSFVLSPTIAEDAVAENSIEDPALEAEELKEFAAKLLLEKSLSLGVMPVKEEPEEEEEGHSSPIANNTRAFVSQTLLSDE